MAQLVRQRPQATKTNVEEAQVTELQSMQACEQVVMSALTNVAYLRCLFGDDAFTSEKIQGGTKVKRINKGISPEADRFAEYMDSGIKDALQRKYLKTLHLAIFCDPERPTELIECYTFNFDYTNETSVVGPDGKLEAVKLPNLTVRDEINGNVLATQSNGQTNKRQKTEESEILKSRRQVPSVKKMRDEIKYFTRKLCAYVETLEELPPLRYVTMKLYYTDDTPADYEPPHFKPVNFHKSRFTVGTHSVEETPTSHSAGRLDTGFHSIGINVVSVTDLMPDACHDDNCTTSGVLQANRDEASSRPVHYDAEVLGMQDPAIRDEQDIRNKVALAPASIRKFAPLGKVNDKGHLYAHASQRPVPHGSQTQQSHVSQQSGRQQETPSKSGAAEKPLEELFSQGSVESFTQPVKTQTNAQHANARVLVPESLPPSQLQPSQDSIQSFGSDSQSFVNRHVPETQAPETQMHDTQMHESMPSDKADLTGDELPCDCECGSTQEFDQLLACDFCDTWKHCVCYGFKSTDDYPMELKFKCYTCQCKEATPEFEKFDPKQDLILAQFGQLAIHRRALTLIHISPSLPTANGLAKCLSCDLKTANALLTKFRKEGYITDEIQTVTGKANSQHKSDKTQQTFTAVTKEKKVAVADRTPEIMLKRDREYFTARSGRESGILAKLNASTRTPRSDGANTRGSLKRQRDSLTSAVKASLTSALFSCA